MATYTVGVMADLHHRTSTDDQTTNLESAYTLWTAEGVNAVLFTGDMIDDSTNRADSQAQLAELNAKMTLPTYWAIGNHDLQGNVLANFLTDRGAYAPNVTAGTGQNGYFDLGNWRVIYIDAVSGTRFSADSTTLTYLETQLEVARLAGKYIVVAMHPLSKAKWPNATSLADSSWTVAPTTNNASSVAVTGNITPSGVSGEITITSSESDFVAGDVGRLIIAKGTGNVWGVATITGLTSATEVAATVVTDHEFPDTNAIATGSWGYGTTASGYSIMAFNADAIRAKIETAVTAGAEVKAVVCGHGHTNGTWTVNSIVYYEFPTTHDGVIVGIMHLESDGTFRIAGTKDFTSRNYPFYFADGVNGDDTNNAGRMRNDAYKTLTTLVAVTTADGDTATILPAVYKENISMAISGSEGSPITWTFEEGAKIDADGGVYGLYFASTSAWLVVNNPEVYGATKTGQTDPKPAGILLEGTPSNIIINDAETYGCGAEGVGGGGVSDATLGASNVVFNRVYSHDNLRRGFSYKNGTTGKATINYGLFHDQVVGVGLVSNDAMTPAINNITSTGCTYGVSGSYAACAPVIKNAILYGNTTDINIASGGGGTISYSLVGTATWGSMTHTTGMLSSDPLFRSATDYRLRAGSSAINAGTNSASGSVTLANTRLSLVSTAPFVDFSAAGTLTPYVGGYVTLTDSAGKTARARILSAGTGETLSDALNVSNCANISYDTFDGASPTGFHAIKSTAGNKIAITALEIPFVAGALFKATYTVADGTISSVAPRNASASAIGPSVVGAIGSNTNYACVTETVTRGWYFISTANVEYTLSNLAIKKVTAPSATGVVTSAWTIQTGFNYNDSGGYTYLITDFLPTTDLLGKPIRGSAPDIGAYEFQPVSGNFGFRFGIGF